MIEEESGSIITFLAQTRVASDGTWIIEQFVNRDGTVFAPGPGGLMVAPAGSTPEEFDKRCLRAVQRALSEELTRMYSM